MSGLVSLKWGRSRGFVRAIYGVRQREYIKVSVRSRSVARLVSNNLLQSLPFTLAIFFKWCCKRSVRLILGEIANTECMGYLPRSHLSYKLMATQPHGKQSVNSVTSANWWSRTRYMGYALRCGYFVAKCRTPSPHILLEVCFKQLW